MIDSIAVVSNASLKRGSAVLPPIRSAKALASLAPAKGTCLTEHRDATKARLAAKLCDFQARYVRH